MLGLLTTDAARLATLKPGSPELTKMRVEVTRQVAQKYGLSGSEPEFIKYVLPEINESWDIFSTKQAKMFNDELKINTQNLVIADVANTIPFLLGKGAPDENGQLIKPGMPKFYGAASQELTRIIDNHMRLLPPAARREVMQNLQTELFGTLARDPFAQKNFARNSWRQPFPANGVAPCVRRNKSVSKPANDSCWNASTG